ncbi:uncharacterized protein ACA1_076130 [Acanthamoeba castellanii str. Neff]|uniref:Uncharacterized protein n=1 Tax=Acanthamoeba castellanii (strain ATCC 30010 / Neff) TaxID=1257118 RepID=L8GL25_ACACF|nr:uncharacterized protein ACA1_076130 [Acanthamoeba castellanii str. Neff]ELR13770.1 hypothetical protein ACA1_076130 [Acanthamoeba castellanii str. Neff]
MEGGAVAATPASKEGEQNAMDVVATSGEPTTAPAISSSSGESTTNAATATASSTTGGAALPQEGSEGDEKNGLASAGAATSATAMAASIAARIQDEEERRAKIDELERKLDVLGEQKHKLFLLLKQVLFVDEKKRKKLAEEERNRLEEQRRAEETRRLMQMKALRDSGKEPPNEGGSQGARPQYGEPHGYMYPPQREYGRMGMSPGGGGGGGYHSSGSGGLGSRGGYPPHLTMSHPPLAPRSPLSPSHSQHSPNHSPLHPSSGGSRDSRKRRAPPLSSYNSPSIRSSAIPADFWRWRTHVPAPFTRSGSHFPQVPPVHIPAHMAIPHGIPLGMLPAQLALQSQLGIPPFPPHMMRPGLLPTPPPGGYRNRGGSGGGGGGGGGSRGGPPPRVRGSDRRGW